ncbi:unnamed protein product [Durusdinium trenchii]|uniref:Uncharacterized protein n=1 Tax=Durusdinium trenchii TaxID=1381693 RepID=A0ABP0P681_9DINO
MKCVEGDYVYVEPAPPNFVNSMRIRSARSCSNKFSIGICKSAKKRARHVCHMMRQTETQKVKRELKVLSPLSIWFLTLSLLSGLKDVETRVLAMRLCHFSFEWLLTLPQIYS